MEPKEASSNVEKIDEFVDVNWKEINVLKFSGLISLSYLAENLVYYPFWVLKTRQQINTVYSYFHL